MNTEFLQKNALKFLFQRTALLVLSGILLFSNIVLGTSLLFKRERTILLPPEIRRAFWVGWGEISTEYLEDMGWGLSKLLLDISPSSFPYNHERLLKYVAPEAHGELKKKLMKEGEQYYSLQLSTHFYPAQVTANPKTLEVEIKGGLTCFVAGKHIRTSQETVTFKFTQRGGGLLVERIRGGPHDGELPENTHPEKEHHNGETS